MKRDNKDKEKSKIKTDDGWNRAFYGSPKNWWFYCYRNNNRFYCL